MSRYWAHILKEYNAAGTVSEFRGTNIKGPAITGYTGSGTLNLDYTVPDIEDSSLTINDTNNTYPIVSYGSKGGVRLMPVVGYSVNGSFSGKLYAEQANFFIPAALLKYNATSNPADDCPSFQIDRCYIDSDPVAPKLYADRYKGVKVGQLGITVGATSPLVQINMQLIGSTCTEIDLVGGTGIIPTSGKVPDCTSYPVKPYTFKDVTVYADFTGAALFTTANGTTNFATPAATKELLTVRSLSLSFQNVLASTSHNDGVLDRIQRTVTSVSYSLVVDLSDPDGSNSGDGGSGSLIWRKRYRLMRDSINGGTVALAVVIDNGTVGQKITFSLGKNTGFDGVQTITPIPDIFSAQISGSAMYDSATCSVFDWNIS